MTATSTSLNPLQAAPTRASTRAKLASKATEKFTQQGAAQIAAAKADKEEKMMRWEALGPLHACLCRLPSHRQVR